MTTTADLMSLDQIAKLDDESVQAAQLSRDADARRNQAILLGVESGIRMSDIAERLGITPGRVSQIVSRARADREGGRRSA